jgi:hypothetical protein
MIQRKCWLFLTCTDEVLGLAKLVRQDLHLVLSQVLLGDHLAADYFICHLISAV